MTVTLNPAAAGSQKSCPVVIADETRIREKYRKLTECLIARSISITTMESCTSGQIASLITDTEGASAILRGAFITYSNEAKIMAGVPASVIDTFGVYSGETAQAMAETARAAFRADLAVGITGSFGNADPNNRDSVPGEVFFAIAAGDRTLAFHRSVPPQPSRYAYKLYMADAVADALFACLDA